MSLLCLRKACLIVISLRRIRHAGEVEMFIDAESTTIAKRGRNDDESVGLAETPRHNTRRKCSMAIEIETMLSFCKEGFPGRVVLVPKTFARVHTSVM